MERAVAKILSSLAKTTIVVSRAHYSSLLKQAICLDMQPAANVDFIVIWNSFYALRASCYSVPW